MTGLASRFGISPALLLVLLIATLVAAAVLWLIVRARKPTKAGDAAVDNPAVGGSRWSPTRWLKLALSGLVAALRYAITRKEWRYRVPWVLMTGEMAAGRSSIAASIGGLRRQSISSREKKLATAGTHWWFFNRGVLIDLEQGGVSTQSSSGKDGAWDDVIADLIHHRPERPLDSLVLVLSARTLLRANSSELQQLAEQSYGQLVELQRRLEFALPVYVLVSQCDVIEGFGAFWQRHHHARFEQMFGWSNPYTLDNSFLAEWTDEAFATMGESLKLLQMQAAAANSSPAEADLYFLFPQRFSELHAPLRPVLDEVFRSSAYHANFFFRGVYFAGSLEAGSAQLPESRHDIAFVDELFNDKVFAEQHLARPTRQGVWSRHRLLRRLQVGAVSLFSVLFLALGMAGYGLSQQIDAALVALRVIDDQQGELKLKQTCVGKQAVYTLLSNISMIDVGLTYKAIPASWFDKSVSQRESHYISRAAFKEIIFPSLRCNLELRAQKLVEPKELAIEAGLPARQAAQRARAALVGHAAEVRDFEHHLRLFRGIVRIAELSESSRLLEQLDQLAKYLYGDPLPRVVYNKRGQHREALTQVEYDQRVRIPPDLRAHNTDVLKQLAARARSELDRQLASGADLLQALNQEQRPILGNTQRFHWWLDWVQQDWINSASGNDPCTQMAGLLREPLTELRELYAYSAELVALEQQFGTERCYRPALASLEALHMAPHGTLFQKQQGTLHLRASLAAEIHGLQAMTALDYMQLRPEHGFQCRAPLRGLEAAALGEIATVVREYQEFARGQALDPAAQEHRRPLYDRLARHQLRLVVDDMMHAAQRPVSLAGDAVPVHVAAADAAIQQQSRDFADVLEQLVLVLRMVQQLGFQSSHALISQCLRDYGGDSLQVIDALAAASRLYEPNAQSTIEGETVDRTLFALGSAAQTKDYLQRQLQRGQVLAGYAAPFVAFLANTEGVNEARIWNSETAAYWENTVGELNRYIQFKEPNGQVALLENLLLNHLVELSSASCGEQLKDYTIPAYGNDLFSERRASLEWQTQLLCGDHSRAAAFAAYQGLAKEFNSRLAGRFPFGDLHRRDASLLEVKKFFQDYGEKRQALAGPMEILEGNGWAAVREFLAQLDEVEAFFASNLATPDASQALGMSLGFRVFPKQSPGSEQVVRWQFKVDSLASSYPNAEQDLHWRYGQSVAVELDWATQSRFAPVDDAEQPDMAVEAGVGKVSFTADGPWALLKLLRAHTPRYRAGADPLDPSIAILEFRVPVVPKPEDSGVMSAGQSDSRLYLSMGLSGIDPETKAPKAAPYPTVFPQYAPKAW